MRGCGRLVVLAGPYAAVGLYVWFIYADYSAFLNGRLQYKPPAMPVAPEDVLGLGFWPTWFLFFIAVLLLSVLVYRYASKNIYYYLALLVISAIASVTDYYLYRLLERQVA